MEDKEGCAYLRQRWYCGFFDRMLDSPDDKFCTTCPQHTKHRLGVAPWCDGPVEKE